MEAYSVCPLPGPVPRAIYCPWGVETGLPYSLLLSLPSLSSGLGAEGKQQDSATPNFGGQVGTCSQATSYLGQVLGEDVLPVSVKGPGVSGLGLGRAG